MMLSLRASCSRIGSHLRPFSTSSLRLMKADLKPSPEAPTPIDLLAKIGRNADKRLQSHAESWASLNEVWKAGGAAMEEAGLQSKERRYILWAFSRYSQGDSPSRFIRPPKPPKKIRGWGPSVQHGIRVK